MVTWDVLIPTMPHRHESLCELLAEFDRQWRLGLGVRVCRTQPDEDALDSHAKRRRLLESSSAEYVCFVDDDDMIAEDYVNAISVALTKRPDYVGFQVVVTWDGKPHRYAEHSLRHTGWSGWHEYDRMLYRDITHLNPVRRKLALLVSWDGLPDTDWATAMRETGQVKTEEFIDRPLGEGMYYYRFHQHNNFSTPHGPMPEPWPELPSYHWLTML